MGINVEIEKNIEIEKGTISVWDKKANKGEGGYRFGKIYFRFTDEGLAIEVVGALKLHKLVKILYKEVIPFEIVGR